MDYIKIDIEDNRKFADVALLVDNKRFIKDMQKLRNILKFPLANSDYGTWVKQNRFEEFPEIIFQKLVTWITDLSDCWYVDLTNDKQRVDIFTFQKTQYCNVLKKKFTKLDTINWLVQFLTLKRYKKNTSFKSVVQSALICNTVTDDDYETTVLRLFPHTLASNEDFEPDGEVFFEKPNYYGFALYFLPHTPRSELIKVLDQDLSEAERLYDELILKQSNIKNQSNDVIPNIKWYRKWYWMFPQNSYQQITNREMDKPRDTRLPGTITRDRIIQGIKAYKKFLAVET